MVIIHKRQLLFLAAKRNPFIKFNQQKKYGISNLTLKRRL